jgi:hypothetical protein
LGIVNRHVTSIDDEEMMKQLNRTLLVGALVLVVGCSQPASNMVPSVPNGVQLPQGYQDWRVIASSHRTDKNSLRVILGNDIAIQAARTKHTNPWPEGSILAKLVWEDKTHDAWSTATVPGSFVHAEFMVKDSQKYFSTAGWGFARWLGLEQRPYGSDASFVTECMGCHTQVKNTDHVYTRPAVLP